MQEDIVQLYDGEQQTHPIYPIVKAEGVQYGGTTLDGVLSNIQSEAASLMSELKRESSQSVGALDQIRHEIQQLKSSPDMDAAMVAKLALIEAMVEQIEEDMSSHLNADPSISADLEIGDHLRRVLVRFAQGHIMTKHFDSRLTPYAVSTTADLEIGDDQKRPIVSISGGHIKTKNFDSRNVYTKAEVQALIAQAVAGIVTPPSGGDTPPSGEDTPPSGGGSDDTPTGPSDVQGEVNILFLGNSFTLDALSALPKVMQELMPNIKYTIGHYYKSGMLLSNLNTYLDYTTDAEMTDAQARYYEMTESTPCDFIQGYRIPRSGILHQHWDWIFFQQGTQGQRDANSYTIIPALKDKIRSMLNYEPRWGFMHVQDWVKYNNGVDAFNVQSVASQALLDAGTVSSVIPCGTAVQNLRTVVRFNTYGDGVYKSMCVDDLHLQSGAGQFVEALVIAQWLGNLMSAGVSVASSVMIPSSADYYEHGRGTSVVGIDAANCALIRKAAVMAIESPNTINDMNQYE